MKKIVFISFIAMLFLVSLAAESYAQAVYFKEPMDFAGTGCGIGSYTISGDGTAILTIQFSEYDAADPADGAASGLQHASCSFAVPIHVPAGYQISELKADWRGFAAGSTEFSREYFFAGKTGVSKTSNPADEFIEQDQNMNFSSCAKDGEKDIMLRINSSIQATKNGNESYNYINIGSLDQSLILKLQLEKCPNPLPAVFNLLL
ncbi:hypothetical protein GCAAIG_04775 [Candidatus Electronema halotolerans]